MKNEKVMPITIEKAFAECVQYYVDKGYTVEEATSYVNHATDVLWVYKIIQEEKKTANLSTYVNLADITKKRGLT